MRYFLDTEFIEYPCTIDLISIGIVADNGKALYLVSNEFDESKASDWVKENVIQKLGDVPRYSREEIKQKILEFIGDDTPEFWADYADYDWVAFCWLFGSMIDLPNGWPMYCNDIQQFKNYVDPFMTLEELDPQMEHNALEDAKLTSRRYSSIVLKALMELSRN